MSGHASSNTAGCSTVRTFAPTTANGARFRGAPATVPPRQLLQPPPLPLLPPVGLLQALPSPLWPGGDAVVTTSSRQDSTPSSWTAATGPGVFRAAWSLLLRDCEQCDAVLQLDVEVSTSAVEPFVVSGVHRWCREYLAKGRLGCFGNDCP